MTKKAGRSWYLYVTRTLRELGLQQATKDLSVFIPRYNARRKPNLIILGLGRQSLLSCGLTGDDFS